MTNDTTNSDDGQSGLGNQPGLHGGTVRGGVQSVGDGRLEGGMGSKNESKLERETREFIAAVKLRNVEMERQLGLAPGTLTYTPQPGDPYPPLPSNRLSVPCVDRTIGYYAHRRFW